MKKFLSLLFVILLTAPAALWLVGHMYGNSDNTLHQGFPPPEATLWLDRGYYQAVEGWFRESLPVGKHLKTLHNWLNYHLFSASSTASVRVGIHGWLYPMETTADYPEPPVARQAGYRLFLELHAVEKIISATGHRFLVIVVPGKPAIYPEYVGAGFSGAQSPFYKALLDANDRHPLSGFVGLDPILKKAKLSGIDVYHKRSRLWSCGAAAAAAEQILNFQELARPLSSDRSSIPCPPPDNDLYRLLLDEAPPEKAPLAGHTAGPHAVNGPVAVVYGDEYLDRLLPFLTSAFKSLAVIDSTQEPTFDRNVMAKKSDWVVLESGESGLERLHLNLEAIYAAASQPMQGVVKRDIALDGAKPVTPCALDITPDGLQIKIPGEGAFFSLPPLSGSTNRVFRMVKLTFPADHQGRITIKTLPEKTGLIESSPRQVAGNELAIAVQKNLSRETRHVIVPLPFDESVEIQINPSQHPGVFILEKAELLSFYGKNPPPAPSIPERSEMVGDIYSGMELQPIKPPAGDPVDEPARQASVHLTEALPELSLADIEEGRIFQRQGKSADIVVTGTYSGLPGTVESRVVDAGTDAVVVPWTVVDDAPENGLYTGILRHIPQGGWYRLHVRSSLTPWVVNKGSTRWGVGMLVACIGQSNMREWFFTGNAHQPSPLVMLHRNGKWFAPGIEGNGALALGNRLASMLKMPIGLLDYSVNGTGLTAKAEWGKGFWLDTGPDGIYRRFIDGVNTAGGSVEVVLWMQGEADAARGTVSREEYRSALERFVNDQIRSDIKNGSSRPRLPFLIIPLVKRPSGRDASCQWIRDAQMDALKTIDECHLAALSLDLENRGRQHLAPAAYSTLGIRTAQTIFYLLGKVHFHRGPAISTVTRLSDRVIDIAIRQQGGTDFTPWSEITGFEVLADPDRTPLSIASVSRKDGNTIRIELADDAPPDFILRYLYGAHPDTSNPVRDNTALRLPLEPFSQ
ncbi:MAG: hypothetical protein KQI81_23445 [Deltaproteobacteria bacterium]|nr:hypothetical protein [Deltaproteobacteria bacterium]